MICNDTEPWKYYIAVPTSLEKNDFEDYIVPAATWAIFSGEGANQSIQELERRIVTEWLYPYATVRIRLQYGKRLLFQFDNSFPRFL